MSKELQALERLKTYFKNNCVNDWEYNDDFNYKGDLDIIENALKEHELMKDIRITARFDLAQVNKEHKALEIIKKKRVDVDLFYTVIEDEKQDDKLWSYNFWNFDDTKVTKKEFDLLKEVLL